MVRNDYAQSLGLVQCRRCRKYYHSKKYRFCKHCDEDRTTVSEYEQGKKIEKQIKKMRWWF